jgi:circadian clock protein KaiC
MDQQDSVASTGIRGLDEILRGGLPEHQMYFIQGDPGAGKTTLALQFLLEGVRLGEKSMYITLAASKRDLDRVARSHGWDLGNLIVHEQLREPAAGDRQTTLFHPAEVELGRTVQAIFAAIEKEAPTRLVIDSLAEIRLLSESALRYRKQLVAMKHFLGDRGITALVIDDRSLAARDSEIQGLAEGVIALERETPLYGNTRRRLEIVKLRGVDFRGGFHDFSITPGGVVLYPRLMAALHEHRAATGAMSSGVPEIDTLLGGGIEKASGTIIMGPAGIGKSALVTQFGVTAANAGEHVAMFIFDENRTSLLERSASLGFDIVPHIENGRIYVQQVDPAEMSPGEFAHQVRRSIEKYKTSMIIIDSLNGYLNAMPEEHFLALHLHELLSYLTAQGVATLLVVGQHGFVGQVTSAIDISYLADSVIVMRYYESRAELRRAISVLKKRSSDHERTIRDFRLTSEGIRVGEPLLQFHGIIAGMQRGEDTPAAEPVERRQTTTR